MRSTVLGIALSTISVLACGSDTPTNNGTSTVASVVVSPGAATLVSLGETVTLSATAQNSSGEGISGKSFSWSSLDVDVATVTSSGANTAEVTAIANGVVTITATTDQVSGNGAVTVGQVVTAVSVSPDTHRLESTSATVQLTASGQDALGNDVAGAAFTWTSSNTDLATIDGSGIVTAVDWGTATMTAMADGASGDATINLGLEIPGGGLLAAWLFNGNADDESGSGNDGIVSGATLANDRHGNSASAYSFDGIDDLINIGNNVKPPFPFTVSAWIMSNALGTIGGIFRNDIWDSNSFYRGIYVVISTEEGIAIGQGSGFASPSTRSQFGAAPGVFTVGDWRHIVVVFADFDNPRFYVDNVEYAIDEVGGSGTTMNYSTSDPGFIGQRGASYLSGLIDDVRVYSRVLDVGDVEALFYERRLKR